MSKKITIGLISGGTSGEHEVSLISAYNIQAALDREKYDVLLIGIDKNGAWFLGSTPEFLENVEDVHQVKFNTEKLALLPQKNLAINEPSGSELAKLTFIFRSLTGNLVKTVHYKVCWNYWESHMLAPMYMVQPFAWTRT